MQHLYTYFNINSKIYNTQKINEFTISVFLIIMVNINISYSAMTYVVILISVYLCLKIVILIVHIINWKKYYY